VRYPVVLFDLDGTVVDTGAIILASMRHAAVTVLGRDYSDAHLLASVGGPGLEAQMQALDPSQVDELVRVYREHNEALHDTIGLCAGMDVVLEELKDRGHTLGIVTAKRRRTVDLAFARVPVEHLFDVVVAGPQQAAYVGDSPFDMQAAKAAGLRAIGVSWGRIHGAETLTDADVVIHSAEELLDLV
jgi:pyrophosphatase PpaX